MATNVVSISNVTGESSGLMRVTATAPYSYLTDTRYIYSLALHVADTNTGGTDYTTDFTLLYKDTSHDVHYDYYYDQKLLGTWYQSNKLTANYEWSFSSDGTCTYSRTPLLGKTTTETGKWYCYGNYLYVYIGEDTEMFTYTVDGNILVLSLYSGTNERAAGEFNRQ